MRNIGPNSSFTLALSPGETPASGAKSLPETQRNAIIACAFAGRLLGTRHGSWHTPEGLYPRPFHRTTINALRARGLIWVNTLGRTRQAHLTATGKWYARALCSAIADDLSTEGVEACHTEN